MPLFRYRLKDPESGEFRQVTVSADSEDEALDVIARQEAKKVAYVMAPEYFAELEKILKGGASGAVTLSDGTIIGNSKGMLAAHKQEKAYKVSKGGAV